jgi:pimeloyl-ACP methyl ester carboxylesterase
MRIVQLGSGPPLVFIPGLQGRWAYMRRAVDALAEGFHVVTFSLADEPDAGCAFDPASPIDSYGRQVIDAMDAAKIEAAVICGISFGGIIAVHVAAREPRRVQALVLASTPGPSWTLGREFAWYARYPRLLAPLFFAGAPRRLRAELLRAIPDRRARMELGWETARTALRAPVSPARMAARARMIDRDAIAADIARISAPTLVIVGEPSLDRLVAAEGMAEYARLIPGARLVCLRDTGHQGRVTRPGEFARAIEAFVGGQHDAAA